MSRIDNGPNMPKEMTEQHKNHYKETMPCNELWTDGLLCAFEYVKGPRRPIKSKLNTKSRSTLQANTHKTKKHDDGYSSEPTGFTGGDVIDGAHNIEKHDGSHWVPIGWDRISELVKTVQINGEWEAQQFDVLDDEDERTIADLAAPYWERPAGPVWWCNVAANHSRVSSWLNNASWLHPAISIALRDESRLISERMKHLLYEVPVRVAGGLVFELLGQSVGDPYVKEDDVPVVLRSWQAQNFLITALHTKGEAPNLNVLGVIEVQELLSAGGNNIPRTIHEVIALLASRLARWDDRLFRKYIFGEADEVELKFINRRNNEDLNLFIAILNQEIRRLSQQVIRVKWSLHAREEIVFELLQHLRGNTTKMLLEGMRKSTREMLEEQEAVRGRIFTIQDVMQGTKRAWLQDRSTRVTHNLAVFGGCGLILSIITGLFGINVDGIPGSTNTPYAFGLFAGILFFIGIILIIVGLLYFGLKQPITEEQVEVRRLELQELVNMFQHEAETHAQVRKHVSRNNLTVTSGERLLNDANYVVID
ncbi:Mg2+ transporter protein, CorA-like/Zinc transport protein ZntB [Artemisia annua]|uniref:Mg2+ transporter protein, CorA-like/Zinc transport protein ZntB n=1 Tax=Artemisia annua TaxID=35608 RepID=A0A2U1Q886_ARTAN|nr:Mg2+ transporter protein, CorA-like/Zinc transport protein ZntB [Artemisia annua]